MRLPLFTLTSVLFPGMGLRLHVFEQRYLTMIERCIDRHEPFGVVLISEGIEVGPPAIPCKVGTRASIQAAVRRENGSIDLFVVGKERFSVLSHRVAAEGYLEAVVAPFNDIHSQESAISDIAAEVKMGFQDYFQMLVEFAEVDLPEHDLPNSPVDLSFLVAAAMHLEAIQRQSMLEMQDTQHRLAFQYQLLAIERKRMRLALDRLTGPIKPVQSSWFPEYFSQN